MHEIRREAEASQRGAPENKVAEAKANEGGVDARQAAAPRNRRDHHHHPTLTLTATTPAPQPRQPERPPQNPHSTSHLTSTSPSTSSCSSLSTRSSRPSIASSLPAILQTHCGRHVFASHPLRRVISPEKKKEGKPTGVRGKKVSEVQWQKHTIGQEGCPPTWRECSTRVTFEPVLTEHCEILAVACLVVRSS